jgi:NADPH2:quinone reductase
MKAVAHTSKDIASLADIELPKPSPSGRDLLVRVEAVSVNPVDTKRRMVETKEPKVLGWDAAGVVEAAGSEATLFKPGDAVYYAGDVTRPGSNSEFHLVDERIVGRKPKSFDFAQAAAIPLTAITAWESYFDRLKVQSGRTLLILGGAGGVGSIGIQIAKLAGLKVIATASRPETIAWVKEMGADEVVDHRKDLPSQVKRSVDYIAVYNDLDMHWAAIGELIAPQGGIVSIVGNLKPLAMDAVRAKSEPVLGADVHAAALQDARHDRAAQAAQPGGRLARFRQAARHPQADARADQRRQPAQGARAARVGHHYRQAGPHGLAVGVRSLRPESTRCCRSRSREADLCGLYG